MHNIRRGKTAMDRKTEKLVIRGNEFYEIDLECIRRKQEGKQCSQEETKRKIPERFPSKESRVKGQLKK